MDDNKIAPESGTQDQVYQDILNQYSQELGTNTIEAPPVTTPEIPPTPPIVSQPIDPALVAPLQDIAPSLPLAPPIVTPPPPMPPKVDMTQYTLPPTPPPSQPGIFKFLFFVSFLIFLGVAGALGWTVYKLNQIKSQKLPSLPLTQDLTPTTPVSTPIPLIGCELNDKRFSVNESFPAADGCNTCTCNDSLTIDCTQKECTVTPTATSTTSAVPADWKTYTNGFANYSIKYPSIWLITDLTQGQQIEINYQPDKTKSVGAVFLENMTATGYNNETKPGLITNTKTIGDIDAKCKTDNLAKTWCFLKNGEKYILILTTKVQGQDDYNQTLDRIISTFKFTTK